MVLLVNVTFVFVLEISPGSGEDDKEGGFDCVINTITCHQDTQRIRI